MDANRIAKFCFDFYKKNIPNKSKPSKNEWTTLASIVCIKENNDLQSKSISSILVKILFNFKLV